MLKIFFFFMIFFNYVFSYTSYDFACGGTCVSGSFVDYEEYIDTSLQSSSNTTDYYGVRNYK